MSIFTPFKLTILHIRSLYSDLLTPLDNSDTLTIGFRSRMATLTKRLHFSISQLFALLKFPILYNFFRIQVAAGAKIPSGTLPLPPESGCCTTH